MADSQHPSVSTTRSPLDTQVGGGHYKTRSIQPVEYIHANGLSFFEGSVIKYVTRWRDKGGIADLEKAKHFIELLVELESRLPSEPTPKDIASIRPCRDPIGCSCDSHCSC